MANCVDPDQTAPIGAHRSSLFLIHAVCFYTKFVSNARQLFGADVLADDIFDTFFFLAI